MSFLLAGIMVIVLVLLLIVILLVLSVDALRGQVKRSEYIVQDVLDELHSQGDEGTRILNSIEADTTYLCTRLSPVVADIQFPEPENERQQYHG